MPEIELTLSEALGRATAAHRTVNLAKAAQLYRTILERNGNHPEALHSLGVIKYQRRGLRCAVRLIEAALPAKPNYVDALIDRGNVLCAQESPQQALARYDQTLLINLRTTAASRFEESQYLIMATQVDEGLGTKKGYFSNG